MRALAPHHWRIVTRKLGIWGTTVEGHPANSTDIISCEGRNPKRCMRGSAHSPGHVRTSATRTQTFDANDLEAHDDRADSRQCMHTNSILPAFHVHDAAACHRMIFTSKSMEVITRAALLLHKCSHDLTNQGARTYQNAARYESRPEDIPSSTMRDMSAIADGGTQAIHMLSQSPRRDMGRKTRRPRARDLVASLHGLTGDNFEADGAWDSPDFSAHGRRVWPGRPCRTRPRKPPAPTGSRWRGLARERSSRVGRRSCACRS